MNTLKAENLSIYRGQLCVADNIALKLEKGKVYAVLGPNGAGKSSLIKTLFGELPYKGTITFDDLTLNRKHPMQWRKKIGYMPQDSVLDASLSALEVVLLGQLEKLGMHISDEQLQNAINIMERLHITHLAQQDVLSLSGGQRQMVMFAQVLLKNPKILLLDEPVSALDMHHQCILLEEVRKHTHENKLITLMILHDLNLASQFADELILLAHGKIQAQGSAQHVLQQQLIEKIYRVHTTLFHENPARPLILPRAAIRQQHKEKP